MGEMAYARLVQRGNKKERRLLLPTENELCFGAQIATNDKDEAVFSARMADENGAAFIDLNCGGCGAMKSRH